MFISFCPWPCGLRGSHIRLGSISAALSGPVCVDRGLIFPNSGWKSSLFGAIWVLFAFLTHLHLHGKSKMANPCGCHTRSIPAVLLAFIIVFLHLSQFTSGKTVVLSFRFWYYRPIILVKGLIRLDEFQLRLKFQSVNRAPADVPVSLINQSINQFIFALFSHTIITQSIIKIYLGRNSQQTL